MRNLVHIKIDRLKERLQAVGLSAEGASKKADLSASAVKNIFDRVKKDPKGIGGGNNINTIVKLASVLECTVGYLIGTEDLVRNPRDQVAGEVVPTRWLNVKHEVGTGYWTETNKVMDVSSVLVVAPNPKYDDQDQWLERVIGNGAAPEFLAGDLLHVVQIERDGGSLLRDKIVIVARRDGDHTERSLRRVISVKDGAFTLAPVGAGSGESLITARIDDGPVRVVARYLALHRQAAD